MPLGPEKYGLGAHFQGPMVGSQKAAGGALADAPLQLITKLDWTYYFNDFNRESDYDATNDWTLTQITGGSAAFASVAGEGVLRLDAPAQNQGPIVQLDLDGKANITPSAASAVSGATDGAISSVAVMGCRFRMRDADASDAFIGLAELNATSAVLTGAGALTSDTHAGFHVTNAADGAFTFSAAGDDDTLAVTDASTFTAVDDEWIDVVIRVSGTTQAEGFWRRAGQRSTWQKADVLTTAAAWDAAMFPTLALVGDAAGDDLDVDFVFFTKKRDLVIQAT